MREVAGKRSTRGTSVPLLSRNRIVSTSRSSSIHLNSLIATIPPNTLTKVPLFSALRCYARGTLFSSFFTSHTRYIHSCNRSVVEPRETHRRKYMYVQQRYHRDRLPSTVNIDIGNVAARYRITLHLSLSSFTRDIEQPLNETRFLLFCHRAPNYIAATNDTGTDPPIPPIRRNDHQGNARYPLLVERTVTRSCTHRTRYHVARAGGHAPPVFLLRSFGTAANCRSRCLREYHRPVSSIPSLSPSPFLSPLFPSSFPSVRALANAMQSACESHPGPSLHG